MNTLLPELALRAVRAFTLLLALALAACGPGTGGTGTGPVTGVYSYAGPGFSVGAPCADDCPRITLRLEPERVEFTALCLRFVHEGPWQPDAEGAVTLEGTLETTEWLNGQPRITRSPAVLRLQFSSATAAEPREVSLTLRDATGANLVTPITLEQGTQAAAPSGCSAGL
ncbi:hypothetical protein [Paracidovorax sp. MALMAid1276]|uniref:hypothetical protein n=1 Tax=Paracidovorax sp. MALMAid1276 TaxID=3411631 RepID=UPI003B9B71AF